MLEFGVEDEVVVNPGDGFLHILDAFSDFLWRTFLLYIVATIGAAYLKDSEEGDAAGELEGRLKGDYGLACA